MRFDECRNKRIVKEVELDNGLIESLQESSQNKLDVSELLEINDVTCRSIISLMYDSFRELLESLALKNGYKIYDHECYSSFLKEIVSQSHIADRFDEIRRLRNAINYYAKKSQRLKQSLLL